MRLPSTGVRNRTTCLDVTPQTGFMKASLALGAATMLLGSFILLAPSLTESSSGAGAGVGLDRTNSSVAPRSGEIDEAPDNSLEPWQRAGTDSAVNGGDDAVTQTYDWPSGGEVPVLRQFAAPEERWLAGHRGVDLAMDEGGDVRAAGDGRVVHAGKLNDRNLVSIEHSGGLRTTYEPVSPTVSKGDVVARGQAIGTLELGHAGPLPVLHWGAKYPQDRYIDPLSLLNQAPIRLWE